MTRAYTRPWAKRWSSVLAGGELLEGLSDLRVRLPDRVASFTGRVEELAWLRQAAGGPVVVTQALAG